MKLPEMKNISNAMPESPRPSFAKMVDSDIQKCETILASEHPFDEKEAKQLHIELTAKYGTYLDDIGSDMYNCYGDGKSFDTDAMGKAAFLHNLFVLKCKLVAYKNYGYRNRPLHGSGINIENTLTATQSQNVNITFEAAKKQIEDMTALTTEETNEILEKIEEIRGIVNSDDNKKSKWSKIKPFLAWLADKSVDVGITLLPLLLKIQ